MLQQYLVAVLAIATVVVANHPLPVSRVEDGPRIVEAFADEPVNYRLPNNTVPVSYDVHLSTHVHTQTDFTFSGEVSIRLTVVSASRTITLHQRQLNIGSVSLVLAGGSTQITIISTEYNAVNEFLTFTVATDLTVNTEYVLTIPFSGILRNDDAGFYRSSYTAADGSTRWLATTQFEQTDARHAFPCYDEPALRALFIIRITHGSAYHALSNMPIVSSTPSSLTGYTTTTFEVTAAPTPTYLIAFVVSDFESKTQANSKGFVQRIYARPNAIQDGDYGLDIGIKALEAFEKYFGIDFTFPKMDQVAIPNFAAGAMENWGLVTYRETSLLFNETRSTFVNRRGIATLIAHEYAHQWFGNLVTPKWWTYIWLNEGFATLFENYAMDWMFPEWKILDSIVFSVVQAVMVSDATNATRPMTHYVENTAAISRLFDNIAYSKSGCVLRMFLNAFTEESFKRGLINYLNLHKNGAADEEELFAELEKTTKADGTLDAQYSVRDIFGSWSRQAGFPIVTVSRNYANGDIELYQERYLTVNETSTNPSIWWIPYNIASGSESDFSLTAATAWFGNRSTTIRHGAMQSSDWLLLNKRQTGYYRVKYDLQNYKLLSEALLRNFSQIHPASRSQLIDDAFDLARTERLSYGIVFDLIKYLEHELEYVPWASAFRGLEYVDRLFAESAEYENFARYILKQLDHLHHDAGLVAKPDEHLYRKQARIQVIQWACRLGSAECLNATNVAVNEYLTGKLDAIHQDHRAAVLCNGIRNATETQYKLLIAKLETEVEPNERNRLIDALACTSNLAWSEQFLQASIGDEPVYLKSQADRYRAFSEVAGASKNSTKLAIQFLHKNLDYALYRYGRNNFNLALSRLASFVVSEERVAEFENLLVSVAATGQADSARIASVRSVVNGNKRWIDRNQKDIEEWILENGSAHITVSAVLVALLLVLSQLF